MVWMSSKYHLTGDAPLIMHNGQTADPLNQFAKAMKKVSGKRQKTDSDYEELARIEFAAGLYIDATGPYIPADVMIATLINAAKKSKEGPAARSGMVVETPSPLEYSGPRTTEELWKDETFRFVALVRVGMNKVVRTRPIFRQWAATCEVMYEDSLVNVEQVDRWMAVAGTQIGLCEWRPRYGRFSAKRAE